eukprot:1157560-Pelagomonas_calceolata.AAC.7
MQSVCQGLTFDFLAKPHSWGVSPWVFGLLPVKFTPGCPGPPSAPPALKLNMQAKKTSPGSTAVPGDGQHGPHSAPPALKLGILAEQQTLSGDLSLCAWAMKWAMLSGKKTMFGSQAEAEPSPATQRPWNS